MASLLEIWQTFTTTLTSVAVAGLVVVAEALLQIILRYSLPDVGYYRRTHGRDVTFFVRNLDATDYRRRLIVRVSGHGLVYVTVEAGPWCVQKPVYENLSSGDSVKIVFTAVPEDAVFIVRARASQGDVRMALHPESEIKSRRSFDEEIPAFTFKTILKYYLSRFTAGLVGFVVVFIGSIFVRRGTPDVSDFTICALAFIVACLSFFLVVPYKGKRTIGGYESGLSIGLCWPDEDTVIRALDENLCMPDGLPPLRPYEPRDAHTQVSRTSATSEASELAPPAQADKSANVEPSGGSGPAGMNAPAG
jgi:hypothetical protein